jgi:hypothetical protein
VTAAISRALSGHLDSGVRRRHLSSVIVYAVVDETLSPASPLGDALDVFVRRENAEKMLLWLPSDLSSVEELGLF